MWQVMHVAAVYPLCASTKQVRSQDSIPHRLQRQHAEGVDIGYVSRTRGLDALQPPTGILDLAGSNDCFDFHVV
jgi:hypothetical protein